MNEIGNRSELEPNNPSQDIADLLSAQDKELGFDDQTCKELAEQPFEEAFEKAYSYLTQAGLDADMLLAPWLQQED